MIEIFETASLERAENVQHLPGIFQVAVWGLPVARLEGALIIDRN
jgi:hypothetical protein